MECIMTSLFMEYSNLYLIIYNISVQFFFKIRDKIKTFSELHFRSFYWSF